MNYSIQKCIFLFVCLALALNLPNSTIEIEPIMCNKCIFMFVNKFKAHLELMYTYLNTFVSILKIRHNEYLSEKTAF